MQQVQYSKTCMTLKRNLRIDWKFGTKLILSTSTEQCHKNNISESQNGPLIGVVNPTFFFFLNGNSQAGSVGACCQSSHTRVCFPDTHNGLNDSNCGLPNFVGK